MNVVVSQQIDDAVKQAAELVPGEYVQTCCMVNGAMRSEAVIVRKGAKGNVVCYSDAIGTSNEAWHPLWAAISLGRTFEAMAEA